MESDAQRGTVACLLAWLQVRSKCGFCFPIVMRRGIVVAGRFYDLPRTTLGGTTPSAPSRSLAPASIPTGENRPGAEDVA